MADLLWPGDERAGHAFGPHYLLSCLVDVEDCWLEKLVDVGPAPAAAGIGLWDLIAEIEIDRLALDAEASGNPVVPLVARLRELVQARHPEAAAWIHRGLTSQDVMDTALVKAARGAATSLLEELDAQVDVLTTLSRRHRGDLMVGRTLTQHAVPITFGLKAAQWLRGILDARDEVRALRFPIQVGGAAGTLAAVVEVAGDVDAARFLVAETATELGLDPALPWHTNRTPFTRYADALVRTTDALGHVANDVLLLARPEIGELAEPGAEGRGGSSTMPHKQNPMLSVLIRRAALAGPGHAAQLHLAAAATMDERPDGAWHTEWSTLSTLSRHTLTAASQATELLAGLRVDTARMATTAAAASDDLLAERAGIRRATDLPDQPSDLSAYLGAATAFIEDVLDRAEEQT